METKCMELKPCPDCTRDWGVRDERTNRFEMREAHFCGTCGRPIKGYEPPNEPLTLDELWEMDGEPVWCVDGSGNSCWCLVNYHDGLMHCCDKETGFWDGDFYGMGGDGQHGLHKVGWLAYRHKPEKGTP